MAITFALSIFILFLSLFFIFSGYVVDGQLIIPWLMDDVPAVAAPPAESTDDLIDEEDLDKDPEETAPIDMTPPENENPVVFPPDDEDLNTSLPGR